MTEQTGEAQLGTRLSGMFGFTVIWIGQVFSLLGTSMTGFALAIWAWELTGQATALALLGFFGFAPLVIASPVAGALVDRHSRKKVMILADFAAGLPTVGVLLLYTAGNLQIWQLYIANAIAGTFQSFHFPAYSAAVTMMLPKKHYGRASGMLSVADFSSMIVAPVVAALLLTIINLSGVLMIDIATFTFAIGMLLLVHIPQPTVTDAGKRSVGSIWKESFYGFRYIYERPSLLGLQLVFFFSNLVASVGNTLTAPMILARTGNDTIALGSVMSAFGVGGLVGSVLLSFWGGPKRKVHGVLLGMAFSSLFGQFLVGLGRVPVVWAVAFFLAMLFLPITNGSNQAIWQAKVAPDVQGRVFATRRLIAQISVPIGMLLAGTLADRVFEPAMRPDGSLAGVFGGLVGVGSGAGMALMFVIAGVLGIIVGLGGYAFKAVRNAEIILPDHDVKTEQSMS